MLMAAATHMVGSAHSSSSSISPPPPWHPFVLVANHHHQQQVLHDLDLATPSPSRTTPAATASPPRQNHNHLRPASRRSAGKPRRPRPSRKLPTTYISADAASFRRMVHQVTGADDVLLPGPGPATPGPELLCRQAPAPPSRGAVTTATLTLLPTLDTSAFLLGAARQRGDSGRALSARPGASCCHGSDSAVVVVDPGAAVQVKAEACGDGGVGGGGGGFPSLESWDEDDALF